MQCDKFNQEFTSLQQDIELNLNKIKINECDNPNVLFDEILKKFNLLKEQLDLNGAELPQYVRRTGQEKINQLSQSINEIKNLIKPKKVFKFNAKKQVMKSKLEDNQIIKNNTINDGIKIDESASEQLFYGLKDKQNDNNLKLEPIDVDGKDIQLCNLDNCMINIFGNASTVHIINCKKTKINIGPVSTSIFIDKCNHCEFKLLCQQLRVHNTFDTIFYLHVTTKGIIEDSSRLKFGIYNFKYDNLEDDIIKSKLNISINNWNQIEDFNWLVKNKQSPNWSLI